MGIRFTSTGSANVARDSTFDAPGDTLVGTADNTFGLHAKGNPGETWRADSTATDGASWGLPQLQLPPAVGDYVTPLHTTRTGGAATADTEILVPLWLPFKMTFDRISIEATAGDATGLVRLGARAHDFTTGRPGTLLFDAGTVAPTSAAVFEATISQILGPGLIWLASAAQGTITTMAFRKMATIGFAIPTNDAAKASRVFSATVGLAYSSVAAGAFPSSPAGIGTTPVGSTAPTLVALRRSA